MLKSCDNKEFCGRNRQREGGGGGGGGGGGKGGRALKYILENCGCGP